MKTYIPNLVFGLVLSIVYIGTKDNFLLLFAFINFLIAFAFFIGDS